MCFLSHGGFSGTNRKAGETLKTLNARAVRAADARPAASAPRLQWIRAVFWRIIGVRDGRSVSRSAALVSPGSESRGGGGAARSSRAGREFPGAGQRERERRVRVMRAVRAMLYY